MFVCNYNTCTVALLLAGFICLPVMHSAVDAQLKLGTLDILTPPAGILHFILEYKLFLIRAAP